MMAASNTSAHVCTTLPPGNLPMRDVFNNLWPHEEMHLASACGTVTRCMRPPYQGYSGAPIGSWGMSETRTDNAGQVWIKKSNAYFVIDNYGDLVEVPQ